MLAPLRAAKRFEYEVKSLGADKYNVRNTKKNTEYVVTIKSDFSDSCECDTYQGNETSCIHIEHVRLKMNLPSLAESLLKTDVYAYAWFDKASLPARISIGWQGDIEKEIKRALKGCQPVTDAASFERIKQAFNDAAIPLHVPFIVAAAIKGNQGSEIDEQLSQRITRSGIEYLNNTMPGLFDHQVEGAMFLAVSQRALLLDEMGLGKTVQAIAAACLLREFDQVNSCLIVAPKSVTEHWENEIKRFAKEDSVLIAGTPAYRADLYRDDCFFKLTTLESLRRDFPEVGEHDLIIVDEVHRARTPTTLSNRVLRTFPSKFFIGLSGTAIEKSLLDLYGIMQVLRPPHLETQLQFFSSHLVCDDFGNPGYTLHPDFFYCRYADHILRREKADIDAKIPALRIDEVELPLTPIQEALAEPIVAELEEIKKRLEKRYDQEDFERKRWLVNRAVELADSSSLLDQQTNASSKLDWLRDFLKDQCTAANEKVVVFTRWTRVQDLITQLCDELKLRWRSLSGRDNSEARRQAIREFTEDSDIHVFVSTDAGGLGVNLQAARLVVIFEPAWNPSADSQRLNRVHRIGQKRDVIAYFPLTDLDMMFTLMTHMRKLFAPTVIAQSRKILKNVPSPTWNELGPVIEYLRKRAERNRPS